MSNYYERLGVDKSATQDELKAAFRKKAKELHPDTNRDDPEAEARFKELNEAYDTLKDANSRQQYDLGQSRPHSGQHGHPFGGGSPFGNFDEMFANIFHGHRGGGVTIRQTTAQISLMDAYRGCELHANIGGNQMTLKIPRGVNTGQQMRVKTDNEEIIVTIFVNEGNGYQRQGTDLYKAIDVNVFDILAGKTIQVQNLDGTTSDLTIAGNVVAGDRIKVDGKGMPLLNSDTTFGDLYAVVVLTMGHIEDEKRDKIKDILNN